MVVVAFGPATALMAAATRTAAAARLTLRAFFARGRGLGARLGLRPHLRLPTRRGLLAGPPVPTISVRPVGRAADVDDLARTVDDRLAVLLDGAPVPVVTHGGGVTALLALVDPANVAAVVADLADTCAPNEVTRRAFGLDQLISLGPLSGRLMHYR